MNDKNNSFSVGSDDWTAELDEAFNAMGGQTLDLSSPTEPEQKPQAQSVQRISSLMGRHPQ